MTKLAFDLWDVASVVGPGAALGLGGAGLGSLVDMLSGTKYRQIKTSSLTVLAEDAVLGSVPPFAVARGQQLARQLPKFPKKLGDIPDYAETYRAVASIRFAQRPLLDAVDPALQYAIKGMEGKILYNYLTWPGQTSDKLPEYRLNPRVHSVMASLIPATDKRQFAIQHAVHFNLEMVPLQLCWKELNESQRDQLFSYLRAYRNTLASTADNPVISSEAENAFNTVVKLLTQYGKAAHATALQVLHYQHKANIQELAEQIQQIQQQRKN
jgi:hypothetical protein